MSEPPRLRRPPIASAGLGIELLTYGLHRDILTELSQHGPLTRLAVTARVHASPTRVYGGLRNLRESGLVGVDGRDRAPTYSATASGRELREVGLAVQHWFEAHPGGSLEPSVGWRAFADLGEAWRAGLIERVVRHRLIPEDVARGRSRTEIRTSDLRFAALEEAGMFSLRRAPTGRHRYRLTPWAAQAIGPLALIARWERKHRPPGASPIEVDDAIVAILATLPLVRLSEEASGIFTLTAEAERTVGRERRSGTVWARLRRGHATQFGEGVPPEPAIGWVSGPFAAWLAAALDGRPGRLRLDGRDPTALALLGALVMELPVALGFPFR